MGNLEIRVVILALPLAYLVTSGEIFLLFWSSSPNSKNNKEQLLNHGAVGYLHYVD